ncbi:oxidoreductase [Aquisalimonas lutea]|uniref:oxidoreductase n=1 Tax=Aquisalimonas lutea TaxID=1327750 RepID=UPI0025B2DC27|nr:oxidoreductase [Aquisalimonas lutea]MDN3518012.1 oxidoreductase [Aquisalimonas lutea]
MPRNWIITGASSGFGRALAEAVLAQGDRAVVTARSEASLADLRSAYADRVAPVVLDLTQPERITAAAREAENAFGQVDVLVNNAGYGVIGAVEEMSPAEYRPMMEANFFGTVEFTRALLPAMRARGRGHIVNISSVAGMAARPGYGFYAASKFALEGMSEALAGELRPLGIHVTLIEPGPFRTEFTGRSLQLAEQVIGDYAATAGASRETVRNRHGSQPGDPARAAAVILEAVASEDPPLRLPLGSYAYGRIREKLAGVAADLDAWEPRAGAATEFSGD